MTTGVQLCVVTVTYHSSKSAGTQLRQLVECVRVYEQDIQLIIVDNSENSEDSEFVARMQPPPNVSVVARPDNPGFAAACNLGVRHTLSPWIVLINADVTVTVEGLGRVLHRVTSDVDRASTYAVGMTTAGRSHQGIVMLADVWFADRYVPSSVGPIGPSGGFGVYPRSKYLEAGGFSEDLFAWGEDADLALRLQDLGVRCRILDEFFTHQGGHSVASDQELRRRRAWLLARNRQIVARRHYSAIRRLAFQCMVLVVLLGKSLMYVRSGTFTAVVIGIYDGLRTRDAEPARRFEIRHTD